MARQQLHILYHYKKVHHNQILIIFLFHFRIQSIISNATTLICASKHIKIIPVANRIAKEIKGVLNPEKNKKRTHDELDDDDDDDDDEETNEELLSPSPKRRRKKSEKKASKPNPEPSVAMDDTDEEQKSRSSLYASYNKTRNNQQKTEKQRKNTYSVWRVSKH